MVRAWLRVLYGIFAIPLLLGWLGFAIVHAIPTAWTLVNLAGWPFILLASVAIHELGHASVGWLVGLHPRVILLGVGKEVARVSIRGLEVRLHALPLLGLTYLAARSTRLLRLKMFLAIAAGPATTAALLFLLMNANGHRFSVPVSEILLRPALWDLAIFANAVMLFTNLLPISFSAGFRSDGRLLLTIPWMKRSTLEESLISEFLLDSHRAVERHDLVEARRCLAAALAQVPNSFSARAASSTIDLEAGDLIVAREKLVTLRPEAPDEATRLVLSNNLAWVDFLIGDTAHLEEADTLSEEVAKKYSSAAFALGTRGAVLMWLGKTEEACALLERAHLTNSGQWARAMNACCLALAYTKHGDLTRAAHWLAQARSEDPACSLLPRANAEFQNSSLAKTS